MGDLEVNTDAAWTFIGVSCRSFNGDCCQEHPKIIMEE